LWILTTNYDTTLEQALTDAHESFRLLYYIGGTATQYEGLFAERAPDGSVRIIERPENLFSLAAPENLVVKLNGGLFANAGIAESVLIAPADFERLAARIPDALPACLHTGLRERSLLFLGHGLAAGLLAGACSTLANLRLANCSR
jgi:SIR2-like domain